MRVFDEHSFEELLSLCRGFKDYRGVIVVATITDVEQVAQELINMHRHSAIPYLQDICGEVNVNGENCKYTMVFETGSTIDICAPLGVHTGLRRYHSIVVESSIYDNAIRAHLENYECAFNETLADKFCREAYGALRYAAYIDPMDTPVDTPELDDFLSRFKVN